MKHSLLKQWKAKLDDHPFFYWIGGALLLAMLLTLTGTDSPKLAVSQLLEAVVCLGAFGAFLYCFIAIGSRIHLAVGFILGSVIAFAVISGWMMLADGMGLETGTLSRIPY